MELQLFLLIAVSFALGYLVKGRWGKSGQAIWKDHITGLPSRKDFEHRLELGLKTRCEMALIIIDLDNFKTVNDQQGHLAGDSLLQKAASTLLHETSELGTLFRWGGDEFVLLITESPEELGSLRTQIEERFEAANIGLSCSTGSARQQTSDSAAAFFQRADQNLYSNKS
ncbi:MAG: hypothetical protein CMJ60_08690 [Planctomycetaceae bacterium]|nr:hypothetical protein [Planctomycetaceae bacterium]